MFGQSTTTRGHCDRVTKHRKHREHRLRVVNVCAVNYCPEHIVSGKGINTFCFSLYKSEKKSELDCVAEVKCGSCRGCSYYTVFSVPDMLSLVICPYHNIEELNNINITIKNTWMWISLGSVAICRDPAKVKLFFIFVEHFLAGLSWTFYRFFKTWSCNFER